MPVGSERPSRLFAACSLLAFALALVGCAGAIAKDSAVATQSAVQTATDADSEKRIDDAVASAVRAAVDAGLDDATVARLTAIAHMLGTSLRQELTQSDAQVMQAMRLEIEQLQGELGDSARSLVQQIVRAAIDEALSDRTMAEVDAAIARLHVEVDAMLDEAIDRAADRVAAKIAPVQAQAAADATKLAHWTEVVVGLLALFVIALALITHAHRKRIASLEARLGRSSS